jgi:transglutaminase-like putative cysteine protease
VVRSASVVETGPAPADWPCPTWDEVTAATVADRLAEYLMPTVYVPRDDGITQVAAELRDEHSPAEATTAVADWVSSHLRYTPGATHVSSSALEVFRAAQGVCQDYVHLSLALLRSMGIPSRYVSGYFHPEADAEVGRSVTGQSHAWFEVWLDDWYGLDPTNGVRAGERHVVVARARDYADVPPMKGVYHGGEAEALDVDVEITRLA